MAERPKHDDALCGTAEYGTCFGCHIRTVQVGLPRDFPTRERKGWAKTPNNSYEKGIPVSVRPDGSQMPYLTANGGVMGQVEYDQKRRVIEENRRRLHNAPAPTSP